MRRSILCKVLGVVTLIMVGYATGASAAACTTSLVAGDDIQAAITAATAGDVICLGAGVYSPTAAINVTKTVTLQGPQAGVDPRPGAGTTRIPGDAASEAIIDGSVNALDEIIFIKADNVVLDGLEVMGGEKDMISSLTATPTTGTIIRHNIVDTSVPNPGDEGMQIRACTDCLIEYNYVFDIVGDGINICCGSSGGTIQLNEVRDSLSDNAAIYVYDTIYTLVRCNLVYDVPDNDGIKLGDKGGGDAGKSGGSILNNTVHHTSQDGISIYMSDTLVEGNDVSYSTSENGAIYAAFGISDLTIRENDVHDNTLSPAKWGDPGAIMIGTAVDATTTLVNNNNITGNTVNGVTNKTGVSLNAEDNWWGAADGPSGPGGTGSGDGVSATVDFTPFLTAPQDIPDACTPVPTYSCDGFEPPMNLAYLPPAMGGGPIGRRVKNNRVLPFKANLVDGNGDLVTELVSPPVIQVIYTDLMMASSDVTPDALTAGKRSDGNEFVLAGDKWAFNLWTKNYSAVGTYTATMQSGDTNEYLIDPTCEGIFVIEP